MDSRRSTSACRRLASLLVVLSAAASASLTFGAAPAYADCIFTQKANISVSNDPNQPGAVVNYADPTTNGGCATVTCSLSSGSFFPLGTTRVNCTSSVGDPMAFNITVTDTQPPNLTAPASKTVNSDPGKASAVVTYASPVATDNAPGVAVTCTHPSGGTFPIGSTTVTCTAEDNAGNTATGSFAITVKDAEAPQLFVSGDVQAQTSGSSAAVNYKAPEGSDNSGAPPTLSCNPPSGSSFPVGATTVTCSATDAAGNKATKTFIVNVSKSAAGGPAGSLGLDLAPFVDSAKATNGSFVPGGPDAGFARKTGTRFVYRLSEAARVQIVIQQAVRGRRRGGRCLTGKRAGRRGRRCTRFVRRAAVQVNGVAGTNSTPFSGRVKGRALPAGRYRARIVATDASRKNSPPSIVSFRILKR